jgi:phthalate 4,5-cis-dihydrodiol dehydrogenase
MSAGRVLRVGVVGLSRAFTLTLPTLVADHRVRVVAAADPRAEARARFEAQFAATAHASVEALCADAAVDVVYIATPHELHAEHACIATGHGKHVLVEKPIAVTLAECDAMIEAAARAGVRLVVGPSHSFDAPILRARALVGSGAFGALRMIHAFYYTDFVYRPRRPEELDSARGGGVVWSQAAHQVDIVRLLGGGLVERVRAAIGNWDPARPVDGAYAALLEFAGGAFASLVYSGYAHFDADAFMNDTSELGVPKDPARYGAARRALAGVRAAAAETALKYARGYGGSGFVPPDAEIPRTHEHFGIVVASCERADLRPLPDGVMIYGDDVARFEQIAAPSFPRREVVDELYAAIVDGASPLHDGAWGRATLEVCLALRESASARRDVVLMRQVGVPAGR